MRHRFGMLFLVSIFVSAILMSCSSQNGENLLFAGSTKMDIEKYWGNYIGGTDEGAVRTIRDCFTDADPLLARMRRMENWKFKVE